MLLAINSPALLGDDTPGIPGHVIRDKLFSSAKSLLNPKGLPAISNNMQLFFLFL